MSNRKEKIGKGAGCLIWLITFIILAGCLTPIGLIIGSITSTTHADFVATTLSPYLCPPGSQAIIRTYETTILDERHVAMPSLAYEARCVNEEGMIVKDLGPNYALVWTATLAGVGIVFAALLAVLLAAPTGALINRLRQRKSE
jgi:ABC-type antimicrobial peptide transport system permease subunit